MSRPRPLTNLSSGRANTSEYQALTPRTPHSRAGRAEEAYQPAQLDLDDDDEEDGTNLADAGHQQVPLLSSASDTFPPTGYRNLGDDRSHGTKFAMGPKGKWVMDKMRSNLPVLAGSLLASVLLFLAVVSYERPGELEKYVGAKVPSNSTTTGSNTSEFVSVPLPPTEYVKECYEAHEKHPKFGDYWDATENDYDVAHTEDAQVCSSTITYMLDGRIGLLSDLALMAQAAALARERNRTFLVDDTYWDRGKWTDHFEDVRTLQPGPEPGCKPPPPEEYVACPRTARHWIINSHTAKYHFGSRFENHYDDAYAHNVNRKKPSFERAAESLQNTIRPNQENARLIRTIRQELSSHTHGSNNYISVHIRRGDRKPSFYHKAAQIPVSEYVEAASESWSRLGLSSEPLAYVASDTPEALSEIAEQMNAFSLAKSVNAELRELASPKGYFQSEFNELYDLNERVKLTRGMVVDFALLTGLWGESDEVKLDPEAVVCTIRSAVCKLSAAALGWDRAFGDVDKMGNIDENGRRWVEIDEHGAIVPVWVPVNMF
ncbi:hypothetical protein K435DRAFT_773532 [Dendrothele bispora CBS 962.96]|uniref:Uncharacterized protein n=1 Tax=Dendrothele bispora (strain CBS 962.96) TaxID=1314807 RepID=A0A4S8MSB0_DENBC|nr:hypothetical protein K435DRAFT_773532 [Dendrothele bispora CBS 962.96]